MTDLKKIRLSDAISLMDFALTEGQLEKYGFYPDFEAKDLLHAVFDLIQVVDSEEDVPINDSTLAVLNRLVIAHKIDEVRLYIPGFIDEENKNGRTVGVTQLNREIKSVWIPVKNGNVNIATAEVNALIKEENLDVFNIETVERVGFIGIRKTAVGLRVWHYC